MNLLKNKKTLWQVTWDSGKSNLVFAGSETEALRVLGVSIKNQHLWSITPVTDSAQLFTHADVEAAAKQAVAAAQPEIEKETVKSILSFLADLLPAGIRTTFMWPHRAYMAIGSKFLGKSAGPFVVEDNALLEGFEVAVSKARDLDWWGVLCRGAAVAHTPDDVRLHLLITQKREREKEGRGAANATLEQIASTFDREAMAWDSCEAGLCQSGFTPLAAYIRQMADAARAKAAQIRKHKVEEKLDVTLSCTGADKFGQTISAAQTTVDKLGEVFLPVCHLDLTFEEQMREIDKGIMDKIRAEFLRMAKYPVRYTPEQKTAIQELKSRLRIKIASRLAFGELFKVSELALIVHELNEITK